MVVYKKAATFVWMVGSIIFFRIRDPKDAWLNHLFQINKS